MDNHWYHILVRSISSLRFQCIKSLLKVYNYVFLKNLVIIFILTECVVEVATPLVLYLMPADFMF